MNRAEILDEIRRTAEENGGSPLGQRSFERATGIRHVDWFGVYWRAWGDAVQEAGYTPNVLTGKIDEDELVRRYCSLVREIGRFPTKGDLRLKRRHDPTFPSETVFVRRFGSYPAARARALEYSLGRPEFADVALVLAEARPPRVTADVVSARVRGLGFVYLVRHGSRPEYKIGKTANPLRREGEIRLQLPEKLVPVHYIETDDPAGVEAYWHNRFAPLRKEGEWFSLSRSDVVAFKKWKRIS